MVDGSRKAFDAGDYATACAKFGESFRIEPALGTKLNLAACEMQRGRVATAWGLFRAAEQQLPAGDPRRAYAGKMAADLFPLVPYLVLKAQPSSPSDLSVRLEDVTIRAGSFGAKLPVDPGKHAIVVSAAGHTDRSIQFEVARSQTLELPIEVGPLEPKKAPAVAAAAPSSPKETTAPSRTAFWVSSGVAATGVIAGSIFGVMTLSQKSTGDDECPSRQQCTARGADALDRARSYRLISNVGWGVAAVGAGCAAYFWLSAPSPKSTEQQALGLGVEQDAGGARIQLRGRF